MYLLPCPTRASLSYFYCPLVVEWYHRSKSFNKILVNSFTTCSVAWDAITCKKDCRMASWRCWLLMFDVLFPCDCAPTLKEERQFFSFLLSSAGMHVRFARRLVRALATSPPKHSFRAESCWRNDMFHLKISWCQGVLVCDGTIYLL